MAGATEETPDAATGNEEQPFRPHAQGVNYLTFMRRLAEDLHAERYFEIGTRKGRSLANIDCDSIAVDPQLQLDGDVIGSKRSCSFFQMTSDEFFANHSLRRLFPRGVDIAFLDGMHRFQFLLRDFIHTEKACRRNSVILLHDCMPYTPDMATRRNPDATRDDATTRITDPPMAGWTGDVWKIIPCLKDLRPDLSLHCLDCPPSGLVLITNLNPRSTVLEDHYFDAMNTYGPLDTEPGWFDRFYDSIDIESSGEFLAPESLSKHLWL